MTPQIQVLCEALSKELLMHKLSMATAESCTGGLISASCTELSGSSLWFDRGFVTYSNAAKTEMLGVAAHLIETHGAVSEEVAKAMALGALQHSKASCSLAVTGIAGPTGGSEAKPVGLVWLAWAVRGGASHGQAVHCEAVMRVFSGNRSDIRLATTELALAHLRELLVKA